MTDEFTAWVDEAFDWEDDPEYRFVGLSRWTRLRLWIVDDLNRLRFWR